MSSEDYGSDDPDAFTGTFLKGDDMDMDDDDVNVMGDGSGQPVKAADAGKITVKFITSLPNELKVTETPFEVPTNFARLGLSEVVNHLLNLEHRIPFDFLVDGQFLRTTLAAWRRKQPQERSVVVLEYVKALVEPREHVDSLHPDWIKCIDAKDGLVVSGGFDGTLRFLDPTSELKQVMAISGCHGAREVWSVAFLRHSPMVITGGKDCFARAWRYDVASQKSACVKTMQTPAAVTHLSVASDNDGKCVLASSNGFLYFHEIDVNAQPVDDGSSSGKKRSRQESEATTSAPAMTIPGHRDSVTQAWWRNPQRVMTSSLDKTCKVWDVDSGIAVSTFNCAKAVTSSDWSPEQNVVMSGGNDGAIGLWDIRTGSGEQRRFKSHRGWISSIRVNALSQTHLFLSGGYDNTVKLWDIRSTVPLFSLRTEEEREGLKLDKVYDVAWGFSSETMDHVEILCGGTQKRLRCYIADLARR